MRAAAVRPYVDGIAVVQPGLLMLAAAAHVAIGRHCLPGHVSLTGRVRADRRCNGGIAVDDLTGKNHLMPSQVPVVERHLEVIGGVVQDVDGDGALAERRGVRARQHDAGERETAEKAGKGAHVGSQYSAPRASRATRTSGPWAVFEGR